MSRATDKTTSIKNSDFLINQAISSLANRIAQCEREVTELRAENKKLKEETAELERRERLKDVIVRGIPYRKNENTLKLAQIIAAKLNHQTSLHIDAFRLGVRTVGVDSPFLIRLSNHAEQKALLSAFRKNKGLTLAQLESDQVNVCTHPTTSSITSNITTSRKSSQIEMSESLTRENNCLLHNALRLREEGFLYSVITRNGFVYIKKREHDTELKIESTTSLAEVFN